MLYRARAIRISTCAPDLVSENIGSEVLLHLLRLRLFLFVMMIMFVAQLTAVIIAFAAG